jgi:hypothetical protein
MINNYTDFFLGETKTIIESIEEETNYDEMMKFFQETDGYVMVPISDPITEDLRILHRGIFPTSSYYADRDQKRVKEKKEKTYYDGKTKEQIIRETSLHKDNKKKKRKTFMENIKGIFSPFPRKDAEEEMIIVENRKNKRNDSILD